MALAGQYCFILKSSRGQIYALTFSPKPKLATKDLTPKQGYHRSANDPEVDSLRLGFPESPIAYPAPPKNRE